jgi:hypothetical protein
VDDQTQQQPLGTADAVAKIEEVFAALGTAMLQLQKEQEAMRETMTLMITERSQLVDLVTRLRAEVRNISDVQEKSSGAIVALGKLLPALDTRIQQLTAIGDLHHNLFVMHGWVSSPAKGDPLAN